MTWTSFGVSMMATIFAVVIIKYFWCVTPLAANVSKATIIQVIILIFYFIIIYFIIEYNRCYL